MQTDIIACDATAGMSERPGHATIAITVNTFSHVLPTLQEEAARDLDTWLSQRA